VGELCPDKGIKTHFLPDGGFRPMPGDHCGGLIQFIDTLLDRFNKKPGIATFEIRSPDGTLEEGVASDQQTEILKIETGGTGGMAGGVDTAATTLKFLFILNPVIRVGYRGIRHTEHPALHFYCVPEEHVRTMYPDGSTCLGLNFTRGKNVVKVCMGVDDADDFQAHGFDRGHDAARIATRIKNIADTGLGITDDGAITLQRPYGKCLTDDIHRPGLIGPPVATHLLRCILVSNHPQFSAS